MTFEEREALEFKQWLRAIGRMTVAQAACLRQAMADGIRKHERKIDENVQKNNALLERLRK